MHQEKREKAKDVIDDYLLKEKINLKSLVNEKNKKFV